MKMMMDTLISLDTLEGNDNEVWQFLRYGNYFGVDVEWTAVHHLHGHRMLLCGWDVVGKGGQHH